MLFFRILDKFSKPNPIFAHCDVPCGIYETNTLLSSALTVSRMVDVIFQLPTEKPSIKDRNTFVRCVKVKEEHAQVCKDQLSILWADFFKPEHLEKFPDLHEKVWKAMKLCSENKQNVDAKLAADLIAAVSEIAKMFDEVKIVPKAELVGSVSDNPSAPLKKLLNS